MFVNYTIMFSLKNNNWVESRVYCKAFIILSTPSRMGESLSLSYIVCFLQQELQIGSVKVTAALEKADLATVC